MTRAALALAAAFTQRASPLRHTARNPRAVGTDCGNPDAARSRSSVNGFQLLQARRRAASSRPAPRAGRSRGGAKIVSRNATQKVGGRPHEQSLLLPSRSSATTPPVCVGLDGRRCATSPRRTAGSSQSMTVSVQVQLDSASRSRCRSGSTSAATGIRVPALVVANLLPLFPPDMTAVRFKFAPILDGSWQIDDVYVDPRMSH